MTSPKFSYAYLLTLLQDRVRERSPMSDEEKAHLKAVSTWLASGKAYLENIRELSQAEAEAALHAYYSRKPRRKAGRPSAKLPSRKHLKAELTNQLIAIALLHLPDDPEKFIDTLAKSIRP